MSDSQSAEANLLAQSHSSELLAANANWARKLNQTFPQYFSNPKVKQRPNIIWIGCSDSRVLESDALAALPGTTFVHRNIANQVHPDDSNALSVLAYALGDLEVQHIAIVGHNHCGGVLYALKNAKYLGTTADESKDEHTLHHYPHDITIPHDRYDEQSPNTPNNVIRRWLNPLVQRLSERGITGGTERVITAAIRENVKLQVDNFTRAPLNEFVRTAAKKKPVWVHGWVYDFENGFIHDLNITQVIQ